MASSVLAASSKAAVPGGKGNSSLEKFTAALDAGEHKCTASSTLVPVLMLLYNDGVYCTKYLPSFMHAMAIGLAHYGFRPRFYFYDNSTDGTPDGLAQLARDFDVRRCSEPLPHHLPRGGEPLSLYTHLTLPTTT